MNYEVEKTLIKNYIYNGNYSDAENLCQKIPRQELEKIFYSLSSKTQNLSIFTFAQYMLLKTTDEFWRDFNHYLILCEFIYVEGMHSIGLHQARMELLKEDSTDNLKGLLTFADGPESIIAKEEFNSIIEKIKISEPDFDDNDFNACNITFDDEIFSSLYQGFYDKAADELSKKPESKQKTEILNLVEKYESFVIYDFANYMQNKRQNAFWHKTATEVLHLLKEKYPTIVGFENIANYHLRELEGKHNLPPEYMNGN